MPPSQQLTATDLRAVAAALDKLNQATTETGVAFCAYGSETVRVGDTTLAVAPDHSGDTVQYVIDLDATSR